MNNCMWISSYAISIIALFYRISWLNNYSIQFIIRERKISKIPNYETKQQNTLGYHLDTKSLRDQPVRRNV